jgi:AcrR family transcriptional regulator
MPSPKKPAPEAAAAPARGRRGRPRSDDAAAAVLAAAYRLTAERGLRGATLDAIAAESGVSKVTIYKWWSGRTLLLVDAFLARTTQLLPLREDIDAMCAITQHATRYVAALKGELGDVQRAVLAECLTDDGGQHLFYERYLRSRRKLGCEIIERGQRAGSVRADAPAEVLYDRIYGPIFYRFVLGLPKLDRAFVQNLVTSTLQP